MRSAFCFLASVVLGSLAFQATSVAQAPSQGAVGNSQIRSVLTPKESIAAFFHSLSEDRVDDAYAELVRGSIIAERKEDVDHLKAKTQKALDAYGKLRSYEILKEATVGTSLQRFTCLSLNEDLPLRWRFYFYDSAKGWKLVDLRVDDGLVELFD